MATTAVPGVRHKSARSDREAVFLLRLFQRLQSLGTVRAIDLAAYGRSLEA